MKDFTYGIYKKLLTSLKREGYTFYRLDKINEVVGEKFIFLRHDVDRLPLNALKMAQIEHEMGVATSYYFRTENNIFQEDIVKSIYDLGHEVGYHYETMDTCKGDVKSAYAEFTKKLEELRKIIPINTICMHGSPKSKWDNREIWKYYNYHDLNIIAEPYFDVDYNQVFYITDTGREWNNVTSNVRDKVISGFNIKIRSTKHLIYLIDNKYVPEKLMINAHPHRWSDFGILWYYELIFQNIKNQVKSLIIRKNS